MKKADKLKMQKMVEFGCVVCRWYEGVEDLPPCNIHHIRDKTGLGMKDEEMIPLCHYHHQGRMGIHTIGKKIWEERYGTQRELHERMKEELNFDID